jgi:hypothetical protein
MYWYRLQIEWDYRGKKNYNNDFPEIGGKQKNIMD